MKLSVYQFAVPIGTLESTPDRGIVFTYLKEYLETTGAAPVSQSLPLTDREYGQAGALPFFAGLLPDGDVRRKVAAALHISESSALKLLAALGGECAGTISLYPQDRDNGFTVPASDEEYVEVPETGLERLILESSRIPLLVPRGKTRLSLAGAQEKIPLLYKEGRWFKPAGGAPTSHILKPASGEFPEIVWNEYLCLKLAVNLGLPAVRADVLDLGKPTLCVTRYDRRYDETGRLVRLHQEDLCQALGILPDNKYEGDGGPSFADAASLLRRCSTNPLADMEALIDLSLFNLLIGNCDAHGKNYSLLYRDGQTRLAPAYDLISTLYWSDLDTLFSMRFGSAKRVEDLCTMRLGEFSRDISVSPRLVEKRLEHFAGVSSGAWDSLGSDPVLSKQEKLLTTLCTGWKERLSRLAG